MKSNNLMNITLLSAIAICSVGCNKQGFTTFSSSAPDALSPQLNTLGLTPTPESLESSAPSEDLTETQATQNQNNTASSGISDMDCKARYISVFEWSQPTTNLMIVGASPEFGKKIGTIEIDDHAQSVRSFVPIFSENIGWIISNSRTILNSANRVSTYINKWNQSDQTEQLTCYFGPILKNSQCTLASPEARLGYQNVGVGLNGVDGFINYLSCDLKYIACSGANTTRDVLLQNEKNQTIKFSASKGFVLKRGCYP